MRVNEDQGEYGGDVIGELLSLYGIAIRGQLLLKG